MKLYRLQCELWQVFTSTHPWRYIWQPDVLTELTEIARNLYGDMPAGITMEQAIEEVIDRVLEDAVSIDTDTATAGEIVNFCNDTVDFLKADGSEYLVMRMLDLLTNYVAREG